MHTRRFSAASFPCSLLATLAVIALSSGRAAEPTAEQILADSGFLGGLIVQVGLADAALAVSLGNVPNALVHGLVPDSAALEQVRSQIRAAGMYGKVSVAPWPGPRLPYADGMVNLLLVLDERVALDQAEVERVLAPLGVARVRRAGTLATYRKPWPADVDEWSHARYDATGNAVSKDQRAGPPRSLQWEAWPHWNRGTKTSALVSARGRLFYILDDANFSVTPPTWALIARDACNGIQLWRHELPDWPGAQGGKKVGPAQVNRLLVAVGDSVYATLGGGAPVSVLNAATGEVIRALDGTEKAEEFIVSDGVVVAMVNSATAADVRRGAAQSRSRRLVAADAGTGKILWEHAADRVLPMALASDGKQVVYHDGNALRSLDLKTGSPRWTSPPTGQKVVFNSSADSDRPGAEKGTIWLAPQFAPTLVMYGDVVAFAGGCRLNVVSASDGRELWRSEEFAPSGYSVPVDLFGFGGCLWGPDAGMNLWSPRDDNIDYNAYDLLTGDVKKRVKGKYGYRFQHHRCAQMKVVGNRVIAARAGIEFLDTETGDVTGQHWIRGSCYYGILPANGHLYVPPHNCACYIRAKLSGFMALNGDVPARAAEIPESARLERGPAFGQTAGNADDSGPEDWPTYRHDTARSGRTATKIGTDLLLGWETDLGGTLTSPVVAGNRVYVAGTDAHTLYALDVGTGKVLWQVTADARIDSPPTVYQGLVLCGCRDGSVHALRAADGALAWRFRACPEERLIVSYGQLESVWPVSGSVMVLNDTVYVAAGKSSYLDGGIRLYGLDPQTGSKRFNTVLSTLGPDGSETMDEESVDGFLNDVLSSDGERIFMRHQILDLEGKPQKGRVPHLHTPAGFLDSDSTSRLLWTYAPVYTSPHQGAFYDQELNRAIYPSGRILVEDEDAVFGYGMNSYDTMGADLSGGPWSKWTGRAGYWALFAAPKKINAPLDMPAKEALTMARSGKNQISFTWASRLRILVQAMVRTADLLFVAGPPGSSATSQAALEGKTAGTLLAVSPADGKVLQSMPLPSGPVWDGMAAASGNLVLSLANGRVVCLWTAAPGRAGTPLSAAGSQVALPPVKVAEEPGLVGRWRFDEGAGMLARDGSGRGHDAEVSGQWATGEFGTCFLATGTPSAVTIPDAEHLHFGNDDFTLAFWLKLDGHDVRLLGKEAFPENWWVINVLDNGQAELVLAEGRGAGQSARGKTGAALATDAWTHLVAVADRQAHELRWYINGALDSRHPIPETMSKGLNGGAAAISIPSAHKPFRGLIGDFRIYRQALSPERVKELFEEEASRRVSTVFKVRD
ncbi:MAG: hypothetical protein A3K19_32145 [Lentisphaerae bacterium RIFOXYB12_FULL_65_16]|nr:MAG: hypothetical protein A3K18_10925 [Lentisphaerae bacterium RIFOXYA12_64_32]OGV88753.1 MAG: hypothetical protein A3K19_32145 [Lentisphaerae bacterium RIFOXYB12_FULL_65_16]